MQVTILTEAELRRCVGMDQEALTAVAGAFTRLAAEKVTMPPIMRIDIPENSGEVDVKSAYLQGLESFAVKLSAGFFDNARLGLPSLSGMMILLSARTGIPEAVLLDNGYLTDVRTGLAGAVAARHLANQKIETVGIIGAGAQARYQVRALRLVRNFQRLVVWSRTAVKMQQYASEMAEALGVAVVQAPDAETVVRQSEVVITTTPAKTPYLQAAWLHPGLHITAMGADTEEKQELQPAVLAAADVLVCDRKSQAFRLGELHHGLEAGAIAQTDTIIELGEIAAGHRDGRRHESQITICDLTGTGAQDTAIAILAYQKARKAGLGLQIDA